jgi:hypothetical protein
MWRPNALVWILFAAALLVWEARRWENEEENAEYQASRNTGFYRMVPPDGTPKASRGVPTSPASGRLISGISENHFTEAIGMVRTAQEHLPSGWTIYLHDLIGDLSAKNIAKIGTWCNVEYRKYNVPGVDIMSQEHYLTNSAWKPPLIKQHLDEMPMGSFLIWSDASARFTNITQAMFDQTAKIGVMGRQTSSPAADYTHPNTIAELFARNPEVMSTGDINAYAEAPMVCGCNQIWHKSEFTMSKIVNPLVDCALSEQCIKPKGADGFWVSNGRGRFPGGKCRRGRNGHCHRGDQAAMSVLLYEVFEMRKHRMHNPEHRPFDAPYIQFWGSDLATDTEHWPIGTERKVALGRGPNICGQQG